MAKVPYVVKDECTECGVCVDTVPTVFRMDDNNKAEVFDPNGAREAEIQEAMDLCPVACIHRQEKRGKAPGGGEYLPAPVVQFRWRSGRGEPQDSFCAPFCSPPWPRAGGEGPRCGRGRRFLRQRGRRWRLPPWTTGATTSPPPGSSAPRSPLR